jgi:hypothetical protein
VRAPGRDRIDRSGFEAFAPPMPTPPDRRPPPSDWTNVSLARCGRVSTVAGVERVRDIAIEGLGIAAAAIGYALGAVFVALMLGGGVYRTECTLPDGRHSEGWDMPASMPYLWDPGEGCEAHTLTRHLLGKAGVMSEPS